MVSFFSTLIDIEAISSLQSKPTDAPGGASVTRHGQLFVFADNMLPTWFSSALIQVILTVLSSAPCYTKANHSSQDTRALNNTRPITLCPWRSSYQGIRLVYRLPKPYSCVLSPHALPLDTLSQTLLCTLRRHFPFYIADAPLPSTDLLEYSCTGVQTAPPPPHFCLKIQTSILLFYHR